MQDSSYIVSSECCNLTGVHNLQPWYPPLYGLQGPRNTLLVRTNGVTDFRATRGTVPAPLTVPYYRYHLSPRFQACALGADPRACHDIYGDFIATYENDDLHGARAD